MRRDETVEVRDDPQGARGAVVDDVEAHDEITHLDPLADPVAPLSPVTAAATRATAVLGDVGGQSASARRRNASRVASDAWLTAACGTNMSKPWNPPPHMWRSTLTPAWLSRVA